MVKPSTGYAAPQAVALPGRAQLGSNAFSRLGSFLKGASNVAKGGGIAAAIQWAVTPTPLNVGESLSPAQESGSFKYQPKGLVAPSVQGLDQSRDGRRSEVWIGSGRHTYLPWSIPVHRDPLPDVYRSPAAPPAGLAGRPPLAIRLPDITQGEYDPWGEEGYAYGAPPLVNAGVNTGLSLGRLNAARAEAAREALAQRNLGGVVHSLPLPYLPGNPGLPVIQLLGSTQLVVSVNAAGSGVVIRHLYKDVRSSAIYAPRWSDNKYGKRLVGLVNAMITRTYGTVSELSDMTEVLAGNMYGVENGVIKPAMLIEGGSALHVFQGYLAGDYRVDAVGFATDYAVQQLSDYVVGLEGEGLGQVGRSRGDLLPYDASTMVMAHARRGGQDDVLLSAGLRPATQWLRAWDAKRSARVRSLFPSARRSLVR